jgi:hypothetical protein
LPLESLPAAIDNGGLGSSTITLARPAANRIDVTLQSERDGLLVVSENWMPGWRVTTCAGSQSTIFEEQSSVLGLRSFSIYRVNLTLLGVPVPAGEHCFALVYWPDSVRLGLWISAGTLALLVILGTWRLVRTRPRA